MKQDQPATEGAGPLIERRYWVEILRPQLSAQALMDDIKTRIWEYAPSLLANFERPEGEEGRDLELGDQFHIRILGPWNGDVRVTDVQDLSFELQTLEGHPEAGRICFSIRPVPEIGDCLHFEIRSLAASRDGLVALTYDTLGVGKKLQETTWVTFCQRVAEKSGGEAMGDVQVRTMYEDDMTPEKRAAARAEAFRQEREAEQEH